MKKRKPTKKDYDKGTCRFGGNCADEEFSPVLRKFPNPYSKRRVQWKINTWKGICFEAQHFYLYLIEDDNAIWSYKDKIWVTPWDADKLKLKGRRAEREFFDRASAEAAVNQLFEVEFNPETHCLEKHYFEDGD